jgi:hypothetical protein
MTTQIAPDLESIRGARKVGPAVAPSSMSTTGWPSPVEVPMRSPARSRSATPSSVASKVDAATTFARLVSKECADARSIARLSSSQRKRLRAQRHLTMSERTTHNGPSGGYGNPEQIAAGIARHRPIRRNSILNSTRCAGRLRSARIASEEASGLRCRIYRAGLPCVGRTRVTGAPIAGRVRWAERSKRALAPVPIISGQSAQECVRF